MKHFKQFLKNKFPFVIKLKYIFRAIFLGTTLKYVEVHIVDHCNLKCNGCTHFSNISEPKFSDARILHFHLGRLNEIFGKIDKVRLLGGEPLLHPDIINILNISRDALPYSEIELITNGLLLDKMPEEFFRTLHKNKISVEVSNYMPIQNKIKQIQEMLSLFKIKHSITPMVMAFTANLNPKGTNDRENTFKNCRHKICTILKDDCIYICPICAYIDKYNKYFNKNIPLPKGINIHSNSAKQILEYLKKSVETCKYCTNDSNYINWTCSNNPKETDWNGKTN
ncbi:radical SAM protein [Candidatus Ruminimicrobiellum ovillum]|uniref:radical SAM protein n=1 Tax=Candidatus Ruminimicrobiellum ovillum TaxID=1947927 RepID=UPI00355A42C6